MTRSTVARSGPDALDRLLRRLRDRPAHPLAPLEPSIAAVTGRLFDGPAGLDELLSLRDTPAPSLPDLRRTPQCLEPTAVRTARLLALLSAHLAALDDRQALELLGVLHEHAEFLACFNVTDSLNGGLRVRGAGRRADRARRRPPRSDHPRAAAR